MPRAEALEQAGDQGDVGQVVAQVEGRDADVAHQAGPPQEVPSHGGGRPRRQVVSEVAALRDQDQRWPGQLAGRPDELVHHRGVVVDGRPQQDEHGTVRRVVDRAVAVEVQGERRQRTGLADASTTDVREEDVGASRVGLQHVDLREGCVLDVAQHEGRLPVGDVGGAQRDDDITWVPTPAGGVVEGAAEQVRTWQRAAEGQVEVARLGHRQDETVVRAGTGCGGCHVVGSPR